MNAENSHNIISALDRACKICGGQGALGKVLNRPQQCISQWRKVGRVPTASIVDIERATRGAVKRHELAPDLFAGYVCVSDVKRVYSSFRTPFTKTRQNMSRSFFINSLLKSARRDGAGFISLKPISHKKYGAHHGKQ
mgnify:CR=1 FL=1